MSAIEEFYVGYLPRSPPRLARRTRKLAVALCALAAAVAAAALGAQRRLGAATFEYGEPRTFVGTIALEPVPMLVVPRPGVVTEGQGSSRYLLVAPGKVGALGLLAGRNGEPVELTATLVYREGKTVLELVPGTIRARADGPGEEDPRALGPLDERSLGTRTLVGEIVDTKCFFGVMNPGHRKPHRACAALCISGGIPPMLRARDEDGGALDVLLVGRAGESLATEVLPFVAEPVEVTG